ncbi:MAG: hypothetical protein AAGG44_08535 [Planctomycetota bacterium]
MTLSNSVVRLLGRERDCNHCSEPVGFYCSISKARQRKHKLVIALFAYMLAFGMCGVSLSETRAQDEESKVTSEQVREELLKLESADLADRDAAEKRLVEMGAGVLKFLPDVDSNTSGEMKIRLQRIRQSMEDQDLGAFFEASKITLEGTMSVRDAIDSIMDQTDNVITLQGEDAFGDTDVTLSAVDEPFWSVMDTIMATAGLRVNAFGTTESDLVLAPGGEYSEDAPPAFSSGPFRVEPTFVQATKQFNAQLPGQLQVSILVTWEPRLEPVFMQIPMSSVKADVGGATIEATNSQAAPEIPLNYGSTTQVDLQLALPERKESKIDSLKGEFVIAVPGQRHKYEFKKFGNGARQSQEFGDVKVVLEGARRNGKVYEMRVLVEFDDGQGALDSFRGWVLSNEAFLLDAGGARVENLGLNTYAVTNNAVGIAYLFQINDDPNKFTLVYESPSSISRQTVAYELKDIQLP